MKGLNVIIIFLLIGLPVFADENQSQGTLYKIRRGSAGNELAAYVVGRTRYSILAKKNLSGTDLRDLYILMKKSKSPKKLDGGFCMHNPGFALLVNDQFFNIIYEGTFCFSCKNIGEFDKQRKVSFIDMKRNNEDTDKFKQFLISQFPKTEIKKNDL